MFAQGWLHKLRSRLSPRDAHTRVVRRHAPDPIAWRFVMFTSMPAPRPHMMPRPASERAGGPRAFETAEAFEAACAAYIEHAEPDTIERVESFKGARGDQHETDSDVGGLCFVHRRRKMHDQRLAKPERSTPSPRVCRRA